MSDLEIMREMLTRASVPFTENRAAAYDGALTPRERLVGGVDGIELKLEDLGYQSFYTLLKFSSDGALLGVYSLE
jgi:hypothetical protein